MIASIGGSGEILHVRIREGRAFTGRGAARFVAEAISRARYAGARGPITVRADAGFYSDEFTAACRRSGARFLSYRPMVSGERSSGLRGSRIERDWIPIPDYEGAYVAEAAYTPFIGQGNRIKGATDHAPGPPVYGTAACGPAACSRTLETVRTRTRNLSAHGHQNCPLADSFYSAQFR